MRSVAWPGWAPTNSTTSTTDLDRDHRLSADDLLVRGNRLDNPLLDPGLTGPSGREALAHA